MNKRQTRTFAIVSTAIAALAFLGLTLDSHRQFPRLTNAQNITPAVEAGENAWHKYNCVNCHTLFGEGAYYAPDLTKIAQQRGPAYLRAYLHDPSQFYDEQRHRRLMPNEHLSDAEIDNVIAFLDWASKVDTAGWPPRPILVSGATIPGTDMTRTQLANADEAERPAPKPPGARPVTGGDNPIALGEKLFRTVSPACNACHSIAPNVNLAGPSLAGIGLRAAQRASDPGYHGKARDAEGYIRESITAPSAYVVPGGMYSANGTSFMPDTFGKSLTPAQLDQLVAYLMSLQ